MPAALLAALIVATLVVAVAAPVRVGFTLVVGSTLLVPDSLVFPYGISTYLNVQRLVLLAVLVRLLLGLARGDVAPSAFRATPVHIALAGFAAVAYVNGVLLADRRIGPAVAFDGWLLVADQLVFLLVVVAAIRTIGDPQWAARATVAIAGVAALAAVWEHVSREPYAVKLFFDELTEQRGAPGARAIETRGGDVRVRAAAGFALAYAWIAAALLPVAVAVAAWARRRWLAVPVLLAVTVLWTYSRSALAGIAIGAVVFVVAARFQGRPTRLVLASGLVAALALGATSTLGRTFDETAAAGSEAVRVERLPVVLDAAADSPLVGGGIGSVRTVGFAGTDASYVGTYVDLGVLGLTALLLTLAVALWVVAAGLRTPYGPDRTLAAASVAGVVMAILGAGAFDLFPSAQSARPFWLVVAIGAVVAECSGHVWQLTARPGRVLAGAAAGLALGVGIVAFAPTYDTVRYQFQSLGVASDARAMVPRDFIGRLELRTACAALESNADALGGMTVDCTPVPGTIDLADVRLAVPAGAPIEPAVELARSTLRTALGTAEAAFVGADMGARPAWASTATVWAPVALATLVVVVPSRRRLVP
jgi:hypothetical protein